MPYGVRVFECPRCGKTFHFKIGFFRDIQYEQFIHNHIERHRKKSRQVTLSLTDVTDDVEVKTAMKIPKEVLESTGTFLKPANLGLSFGRQITCTITADVVKNNNLYSAPVKYTDGQGGNGEGNYSLNKTALRAIGKVLGDETEVWIGATFNSIVASTRNPTTNSMVLAFSIDPTSIKGATRRK